MKRGWLHLGALEISTVKPMDLLGMFLLADQGAVGHRPAPPTRLGLAPVIGPAVDLTVIADRPPVSNPLEERGNFCTKPVYPIQWKNKYC